MKANDMLLSMVDPESKFFVRVEDGSLIMDRLLSLFGCCVTPRWGPSIVSAPGGAAPLPLGFWLFVCFLGPPL